MFPKNRPPTHPGEILLEEFLKPLKISQEQFSRHLGGSWTQPKISEIINKKRRVTEAIALEFVNAHGTPYLIYSGEEELKIGDIQLLNYYHVAKIVS